jgi:hypothetical protein
MQPQLAVLSQQQGELTSPHPDAVEDLVVSALPHDPEDKQHQRVPNEGCMRVERDGKRRANPLQVLRRAGRRSPDERKKRRKPRAPGEEVEQVFVVIAKGTTRRGKNSVPVQERPCPRVTVPRDPEEDADFQGSKILPVVVSQG